MKGLAHVGLQEQVASAGVEPARQRVQHWQDGRTLVTMERADCRERYGAPYVYIHRADLHGILVSAAEAAGVELMTDSAVTNVVPDRVKTHDGSVITGDAVIGADGLKSVVRNLFDPAPAHFTGHVAWRVLVPVTPQLQDLAAWPGVHIGPDRMVVRYPVRDQKTLNLVFFARQDGWHQEGWTIPAGHADLSDMYANWCPEVAAMIDAASAQPLYKWAINARTGLDSWIFDDHITLLGDAAHAMTPFLGQGAACAIEDAVVLARALRDSASATEGLQRYEAARLERTTFIQSESNQNADRMQGDDSNLFGMVELRNEEALGLFDYDCRTTPI
jgi:salicylate hydroxylase